jgi:hypothetical protein
MVIQLARGRRYGAYNVRETRPAPGARGSETIIAGRSFKAGERAFDLSHPFRLEAAAYYVSPAPPGSRAGAVRIDDVFVDARSVVTPLLADGSLGECLSPFGGRGPGQGSTMTTAQTTVLFIAGSGRSCSTFLGHILGQIKGFCFVGEAIYAWRVVRDRICGCGAPLKDCDFWTAVRRRVGSGHVPSPSEFFALGRLVRSRHLPLTFLPDRERRLESRYGQSWTGGERLYEMTAAVSGAEVIVDSSKSVPYARMLDLLPGLDVRIVHLVRDARAVAHSWTRQKPAPDRPNLYMGQRAPFRSALNWNVSNMGAELFCRTPGRYLRLRYEDLAEHPRDAIQRILRLASHPRSSQRSEAPARVKRPFDLPFIDEHTVELGPTHSISGNPDRLNTGPIEVKLDARWKTEMTPANRRLVTALTWPLLARYGYLGR